MKPKVTAVFGAEAGDLIDGLKDPEGWGEEGGGRGIGMGNTCKSMADSCQHMAKTTTIL